MKDLMIVAIAQMSVLPSMSRNLDEILSVVRAASEQRADVVVFPETALTGYLGFSQTRLDDLAPMAVQDALTRLRAECRLRGIAVVVGQYFKRCGRWYNNGV